MGWNQPSDIGRANAPSLPGKREKSHYRYRRLCGAIAALIMVAGASIAAYFLLPDGDRRPKTPEKRGVKPIPESTPAITGKSFETNTPPKPKQKMYWEVDESETNGFTEVMQRKWQQVRRPRLKPQAYTRKKQPYEIFEHFSENRIAGYIAMKPGTSVIGTPKFDKRFVDDFLKSCEEPIIVNDDDSDYEKELKQGMTAVKIDLKNRMDNGENLGDILLETHRELRKLGETKREIAQMVKEQLKTVESEKEADIIIESANKLLSEKGISPVPNNAFIKASIKHAIRINSQNQKQLGGQK